MGGVMASAALSAAPPGSKPSRDIDHATFFDANSLLMFVTNTGSFADGLYFPIGEGKTVVFAAGLWLGAKVNGEVRVTVAEYADEYVPGPMSGGTFQPDHPDFHVYKINAGDTRLTNPDYAEWPFDQGAPAVKDYLGNDSLDAEGFRIPLLLGDQALWAVFNDADPDAHYVAPGWSSPLGVEVQLYAYGDDETCPSGRTITMRYTIINKGGNLLEDTYVSFWADPDLGNALDDLVGCDTIRSLGFAHNDSSDATYGAAPPAVGFGLMQGPIVPSPGDSAWRSSTGECLYDFANLPMTAFSKTMLRNGTDPESPFESYNLMQGLDRSGGPVVNPVTGLTTKYMYSGDPVAGTGWVDTNPDDCRYFVSSGPFSMAPGDTQEVVMAVMVGQGTQQFGYQGDTVFAAHVAGTSSGSAYAIVLDETATTGHDYRITLDLAPDGSEYTWSVRDVTDGIDVVTGLHNQDGGDDYPLLDGMVVKLIGPIPGVDGWDVSSGPWRLAPWNGNGLGFEGFLGAIGWDSPNHMMSGGPPGVPMQQIKNVELRLATADENGVFDPNDPNVSYAYRYGAEFGDAPARPEFAPFMVNTAGTGWDYQDFTKSVPLSAWDMDADPPRRLAVGHLENNVFDGLVDGIYWPPPHNVTNNTSPSGPREWLWIFDADYSETPNPAYEVEVINNPLPIMYWLTVTRFGNVPFETGDEFLIRGGNHNTDADVFEFTAPEPVVSIAGDIPTCWPGETLASVTALRRVDSVAQSQFGCGRGSPPVAVDDAKGARDGVILYVVGAGVLTNDFDPDGDPLTAILDTDVSHGDLTLNSDGSLFYTPDAGFNGVDQFTYFAHDGQANSVTPATVALHVKSGGAVLPGDYDEDGALTALDLGAQIDALFAGGPDPTDGGCRNWPRGDVDCDGFSTSLDLGILIDHLFAGGADPCDPCEE
jgi:hypothetical protein